MGKLLRRLVVLFLGVGLLAGCAHSGSTAAIVNGVEIPDSQVVEAAEACAQVMGRRAEDLRLEMVMWAVLAELSEQYLAEHPTARPDRDQLVDYLRGHPQGAGLGGNQVCEDAALGLIQHKVLMLSLGAPAGDYPGNNEVVLNPRYGVWSPQHQEPNFWAGLSELGDRG